MFHFELQALRRFDAVFTMSNVDAALLLPYLPASFPAEVHERLRAGRAPWKRREHD
jgi:hypothetical protein